MSRKDRLKKAARKSGQVAAAASSTPQAAGTGKRLMSLDAFRGFTIFGMVFVIAVAAGGYQWEANPLPMHRPWFSLETLPISTWFHADQGFNVWAKAQVDAEVARQTAEGIDAKVAREQALAAIRVTPEHHMRNVGLTITDLVAPWFVFIVGACIPLSRAKRGPTWWYHVMKRTLMLIIAGMLYISLVIKQVAPWWGVLQAIGIAYLCAALASRLSTPLRWASVFVLGIGNIAMSLSFPWWTEAWETPYGAAAPAFGTLSNPGGDWLRLMTIHCQPWLSVSYGTMAIIGLLLGDALVTGEPRRIISRCLLLGGLFTALGLGLHEVGMRMGEPMLAMNKPDVTTSYAYAAAGMGALCYLLFYVIIDRWNWRLWAWPFIVLGVNPLLAYFMMIIQRRMIFEPLGLIDIFNRTGSANAFANNWAAWLGSADSPSQTVLWVLSKGGWGGVFWGLVWTVILTLIIHWCNKRQLFWRL